MRKPQKAQRRRIRVHVGLAPEASERFDHLAARAGLTRSGLLREVIEEYLERDAETVWLAGPAARGLDEEGTPWEQAKQMLGV